MRIRAGNHVQPWSVRTNIKARTQATATAAKVSAAPVSSSPVAGETSGKKSVVIVSAAAEAQSSTSGSATAVPVHVHKAASSAAVDSAETAAVVDVDPSVGEKVKDGFKFSWQNGLALPIRSPHAAVRMPVVVYPGAIGAPAMDVWRHPAGQATGKPGLSVQGKPAAQQPAAVTGAPVANVDRGVLPDSGKPQVASKSSTASSPRTRAAVRASNRRQPGNYIQRAIAELQAGAGDTGHRDGDDDGDASADELMQAVFKWRRALKKVGTSGMALATLQHHGNLWFTRHRRAADSAASRLLPPRVKKNVAARADLVHPVEQHEMLRSNMMVMAAAQQSKQVEQDPESLSSLLKRYNSFARGLPIPAEERRPQKQHGVHRIDKTGYIADAARRNNERMVLPFSTQHYGVHSDNGVPVNDDNVAGDAEAFLRSIELAIGATAATASESTSGAGDLLSPAAAFTSPTADPLADLVAGAGGSDRSSK